MKKNNGSTYAEAGVDAVQEDIALKHMLTWITKTFAFRQQVGSIQLDIGYFANVVDIGHGIGLALSTDGVGTKILIAQMMDKYDTVGIDCVAMNANDVICVGAEPITMLDYIAVEQADPELLESLAKGLHDGAEIARVTISGGEVAQVRDIIKGQRPGRAFDLVGVCVGTVPLDRIITGKNLEDGDVLIGLASSGIHSNGLSLARKIFFEIKQFPPDKYLPELGRTIGEELLEPTHIYVPEVMEMLNADINIKALFNITGDGLLNIIRAQSVMGFVIDYLPEPQPIFRLIQEHGNVSDKEMYTVYNMGIGFCVAVSPSDASKVRAIAEKHGVASYEMGYVVREPEKTIIVKPKGLVGKQSGFSH